MEMVMILLVSAVAQLVSPAVVPSPHAAHFNLNEIIDLVQEKKAAFKHDYFVEDVQELADKGCKNVFFCKVENILQHHDDDHNKADKRLVQKLGRYINNLNVNCTEEVKNVPKSEVSKPFVDLLNNLNHCIKSRKFNGDGRTSTSAPSRP